MSLGTLIAAACLLAGTRGEQYVPPFAYHIPITYKINPKQTECIYERFEKSDFVTFSVFISEALDGGPPKASIAFEGPVGGSDDALQKIKEIDADFAPDTQSLGRELRTGVQGWMHIKDSDRNVRYDKRLGIINRSVKVDWTHAGESEDMMAARAEIEREKKEAYRNYGKGPPQPDQEAQNEKFRTVTMPAIGPFEETNAIKATGWYRLCASAEQHGLLVEMDFRSGAKMGGVDRTTGHVYTHEAREMMEEEQQIEESMESPDASTYASLDEETKKVLDNQVKEGDLHASKAQIKHLNTMVLEMKKKHHEHQQRIKMHSATANRNYKSYVRSGKLETLLYVILAGVQVWTFRKWLLTDLPTFGGNGYSRGGGFA
ncbi:hypothetical protein ACHAXT_012233 [Thalassiosira profunda]